MKRLLVTVCLLTLISSQVYAFELKVSDKPNDDGTRLVISWDQLPPDELKSIDPETYSLLRSTDPEGDFTQVDVVSRLDPSHEKTDENLTTGQEYFYKLAYQDSTISWESNVAGPAVPPSATVK